MSEKETTLETEGLRADDDGGDAVMLERRKTPRVPFRVSVHVEVIKRAPRLH